MRGLGIILNSNYDVQVKPVRGASGKIESGLIIGNTLYQNQGMILILHPGEITEVPQLGVGIEDMLMDNDYLAWKRMIRMNMEMDGQVVDNISFSKNKKLQIDAHY